MGDPLSDLLPNQGRATEPEQPADWEMYKVQNTSKWDFSIPVNSSKNKVPVTFKAGQVREFPLHRAKWLANQLAKRILIEQWKEEEATTGKASPLLRNTADREYMEKSAAALFLGKAVEEEAPVEEKVEKKGNPDALRKWRAEQKLIKELGA